MSPQVQFFSVSIYISVFGRKKAPEFNSGARLILYAVASTWYLINKYAANPRDMAKTEHQIIDTTLKIAMCCLLPCGMLKTTDSSSLNTSCFYRSPSEPQ
jgi:hypothetical protein